MLYIPEFPNSPFDLDQRTIEFIHSLEDKIDNIDSVCTDEVWTYILAQKNDKNNSRFNIMYNWDKDETIVQAYENIDSLDTKIKIYSSLGLYKFTQEYKTRQEQSKEYKELLEEYIKFNIKEAREKVSDIILYTKSIPELEQSSGKKIKKVNSMPFICALDTFHLRIKAYKDGADAIADYKSGPVTGKPIKFLENY
ncbi:MAG: hypothetical protein ACOC1K_04475 [Nanoarchaeota archaeon]